MKSWVMIITAKNEWIHWKNLGQYQKLWGIKKDTKSKNQHKQWNENMKFQSIIDGETEASSITFATSFSPDIIKQYAFLW